MSNLLRLEAMKTTLLVFMIFGLLACTDDSENTGPQYGVNEITDIVVNGQWRVSYFVDSNQDKTGNFNGFTFQFTSDGSLAASSDAISYSGSWMVAKDDSGEDVNDLDNVDFNVLFATPTAFVDLNEDWEIVTLTESRIELAHVSGSNGETDLLTFEKI
jgi:hypothetical protein